MNTTTYPFMTMDMTKVMADLDPAKMADKFAKMAGTYKMPQFDVDTLVAAQRKNIEALTAANKAAVEGMQALAARQNEILQETMKEATAVLNDLTKIERPEDAAAKQAELLKVSFD
ncbi:MAG: phasin family protein, partial [Rhodospirillaceae bacterium]